MRLLAIILGMGICLCNCQSGVEVARIAPDELISVSSFLSPQDTLIRVNVLRGRALNTTARVDSALIRDAQVIITSHGQNIQLTYNEALRCYVTTPKSLPIKPSERYHLRVKVGSKLCTASCQIPENPIQPTIQPQREEDHFIGILDWPSTPLPRFFTLTYELRDVIFKPQLGSTRGPYTGFLTDNLFDRQKQNTQALELRVFNAYKAERISLRIVYQALDEPTFRYLKTYRDFDNWRSNTSGFIPNLREPQPVFSNIEGGVGIFGGYNQTVLNFKIK
ncbi:MAG: DUF4249 domain-containing protein [Runella sp.]